MKTIYYTEQLSLQKNIHRISMLLAMVFLIATVLLLLYRTYLRKRQGIQMECKTGRKAERQTERKTWIKAVGIITGILLFTLITQNVSAACLSENSLAFQEAEAEIQVLRGNTSEEGTYYDPPVCVSVCWYSRQTQAAQNPLKIEYTGGNYAESLELDIGFGSSVTDQLETLEISWISISAEYGSGDASEGKNLQFIVEKDGFYHFEAAGKTLEFSIGSPQVSAESPSTGDDQSEIRSDNQSDNQQDEKTSAQDTDNKKPEADIEFPVFQREDGRQFAVSDIMKISIEEQNFDTSCEPEVTTAVKNGTSFSGWTLTEKGAEGTLKFYKDGEYAVTFQGRDLSGNFSEKINTGTFIIDQTVPKICIKGVKNTAAYTVPVTPVIQIEDSSVDPSGITCSLKGAKCGSLAVDQLADTVSTDKGVSITMDRFPNEKDDVYTLSVKAEDQAGNTAEEIITFSKDQYGSSYILSDATRELVDTYYITEPEELVLSETNTSAIIYQVTVSKDGTPRILEEGKDYCVETRGGDGDWLIYTYRIYASNFQEEGAYHVDITSRDQASNVNNNQMRGVRIDFVLDRNWSDKSAEQGKTQKNIRSDAQGSDQSTDEEEETADEEEAAGQVGNSSAAQKWNALPAAAGFILLGGIVAGVTVYLKKYRRK